MSLNPDQDEPFKIICDACDGRRFLGVHPCEKCHGDGYIIITPTALTVSQKAAKEMALLLVVALIAGIVIVGALRWLGVI